MQYTYIHGCFVNITKTGEEGYWCLKIFSGGVVLVVFSLSMYVLVYLLGGALKRATKLHVLYLWQMEAVPFGILSKKVT